jgi:hypothetical protein
MIVEIRVELVHRATRESAGKVEIEAAKTPRDAFLNAVKFALLVLGMETKQLPLRKPAPPIIRWDDQGSTLPSTPLTPPPRSS